MSDEDVREAVLGELAGLSRPEKIKRGRELIELLGRDLTVAVADVRAVAALEMKEAGYGMDRIAALSDSTAQSVPKMVERGRRVRASQERVSQGRELVAP